MVGVAPRPFVGEAAWLLAAEGPRLPPAGGRRLLPAEAARLLPARGPRLLPCEAPWRLSAEAAGLCGVVVAVGREGGPLIATSRVTVAKRAIGGVTAAPGMAA
jgi:hypothetical protein